MTSYKVMVSNDSHAWVTVKNGSGDVVSLLPGPSVPLGALHGRWGVPRCALGVSCVCAPCVPGVCPGVCPVCAPEVC